MDRDTCTVQPRIFSSERHWHFQCGNRFATLELHGSLYCVPRGGFEGLLDDQLRTGTVIPLVIQRQMAALLRSCVFGRDGISGRAHRNHFVNQLDSLVTFTSRVRKSSTVELLHGPLYVDSNG